MIVDVYTYRDHHHLGGGHPLLPQLQGFILFLSASEPPHGRATAYDIAISESW